MRIESQNTTTGNHHQSTPKERFPEPQDLIREESANECKRVDKCLSGAILKICRILFHKELTHHKNSKHSAHAIEAETLPHFREEEIPELFRVFPFEVLDFGECL